MPPAGLPQGSSNGQAADSRWWRGCSDLPLGRHPGGCQTPADPSRRKACLDAPTTARQNRVCRPRGRSEQPRPVGCGSTDSGARSMKEKRRPQAIAGVLP